MSAGLVTMMNATFALADVPWRSCSPPSLRYRPFPRRLGWTVAAAALAYALLLVSVVAGTGPPAREAP
ncbi:hypothetical protein [Sphaerisporangium aureirubrum]|uniref:Uncharacterized protein n=1 Tax=Sphaerisporangium aureirubrum TaxID=1544736 RepID=A0ABW1NYM9_9ACTN